MKTTTLMFIIDDAERKMTQMTQANSFVVGFAKSFGAWWNQLNNTTLAHKPLRVSMTLWKDVWSKLLAILTDVSWLEQKQLLGH